MTTLAAAVQRATRALQEIAETTTGARRERAAGVALVLRCVEGALEGDAGAGFLRRRAEREVTALPGGPERGFLRRLLLLAERMEGEGVGEKLARALVDFAGELESTRRLPEADAVMGLARSVAPGSAEVALHAGRIARKQGDRPRALELYRAARALDAAEGSVGRLAEVGEAVLSADPERALGRVLRGALDAGDGEVAAVALEERARLRRSRGARRAAARDLGVAAVRFPDAVDRARVAHQLADLCVAGDDPLAAREALLLALAVGDATQRDHARGRLHTVSRDLEDQVGMRRWRSFGRTAMVSLSSRPGAPVARSAAPVLARWRERVEGGMVSGM